jgi:hypothetical protein
VRVCRSCTLPHAKLTSLITRSAFHIRYIYTHTHTKSNKSRIISCTSRTCNIAVCMVTLRMHSVRPPMNRLLLADSYVLSVRSCTFQYASYTNATCHTLRLAQCTRTHLPHALTKRVWRTPSSLRQRTAIHTVRLRHICCTRASTHIDSTAHIHNTLVSQYCVINRRALGNVRRVLGIDCTVSSCLFNEHITARESASPAHFCVKIESYFTRIARCCVLCAGLRA